MRRLILIVAALLSIGCVGRTGLAGFVDTLTERNNAIVKQLDDVQQDARSGRKEALDRAAREATSVEDGIERMDRIDDAYRPIFDAIDRASVAQHVIGKALEKAQEEIQQGRDPSIVDLIDMWTELQHLIAQLLSMAKDVPS